ncbi:MAG: hypothetical protein ACRELA_00170, partial [Candidatus Rokuibacteriota bacterium]
ATSLLTDVVAPSHLQSYMWRSTDGGATWSHIGLPLTPGIGPRSIGPGFGDPDLAVAANNRVWFTDLEALTQASVSWSDDDGATWILGNPVASGAPIDRQWLAASGNTAYFTGNYLMGPRQTLKSDNGLVWQKLGTNGCSNNVVPGDMVASPLDGTLYIGCGPGVARSTTGASWSSRMVPGHSTNTFIAMAEPAVDSAGNVWIAWQEGWNRLWVAGSSNKGETWPWVYDLTPQVQAALGSTQMNLVWPWVSAGSAGRIAVSAYATPTTGGPEAGPSTRQWDLATVAVFGANTATPLKAGFILTPNVHRGTICQSGTTCQFNAIQGRADRRLGDFFETTIDKDGFLHAAYSETTTFPGDWVSHPGYVRQTDGPRFVVDGYGPTQG